jgi:hypothetical protein
MILSLLFSAEEKMTPLPERRRRKRQPMQAWLSIEISGVEGDAAYRFGTVSDSRLSRLSICFNKNSTAAG